MLAIIVLFSIITIARSMLQGDNLYDVVKESVQEKLGDKKIEQSMIETMIPEEQAEEISKYINENKLSKEMGNLISGYLKYTSGVTNEKPDMTEFKAVIDDAIKKYEKETGKKVDTKRYDDAINSFEEEIVKKNDIDIDDKVRNIFGLMYSNTLYYGMIAVFVICLLFIYLINRNFITLFRSTYIVFIISSVFFIAISILSKYLNNLDAIEMSAFKKISALTRKCGIIEAIVAIVLIILVLIIKNVEKKKKEAKKLARKKAKEEKEQLIKEETTELASEESDTEDMDLQKDKDKGKKR